MAAAPLVALRDVGKVFASGTEALAGLNLAIGEHEFVSLLGPSGCGKSTALRLIAGLGELSSGRIEWRERRSTAPDGSRAPSHVDARAHSHDIGFVFQEPTLMPWATTLDNVRLPLRLAGVAKAERTERARETLALVGLDGFEEAYPRELSGGMKMRVSLARALVTGPRLLLLDEPFAALDEITRFRLNDDLLRLWQAQAWTVVFVTHSVFESVYLSSRIAVMAARPGRIIEEIAVDQPYPRDEGFRLSAPYADTCRLVSGTLNRAMGQ